MKEKVIVLIITYLSCFSSYAQAPFVSDRNHLSLENWVFKKGEVQSAEAMNLNTDSWQKIKVPHTYSMDAISKKEYYKGEAWYRTEIQIPKSMIDERIFIRFEGVGHDAWVYVNGKKVGSHSGGYSAFCFDITRLIKPDQKNTIAIRTTNQPNKQRLPVNDKLFNLYGGIYRPVQVFSTPAIHISPVYYASSGVFINLKDINDDVANIDVQTHISGLTKNQNANLSYQFFNAKNQLILEETKSISFPQTNQPIVESFKINQPIRWHGKQAPHLYRLKVVLSASNQSDEVNQTFGLRTLSVNANKGFYLNEKPYRLHGVCMHQEWKQYGPALSPKQHQTDIDLVDEMGATSLRLSHYQHSDITYELADKKGILVWAEIPFVHNYTGQEEKNAKQQLRELILQNYNHPSIYVWGLWNEVRSKSIAEEPCMPLMKSLNELANHLDSSRLTTSASRGKFPIMGGASNLQAWNKYYGWYYGEYQDMATWLDSTHDQYPDMEIGISEYGIGGNIYQQDISKLEKPVGHYFPEPEHTLYHEVTWKIIKDRPFVWSSFVWNMFDFSVAGWNRGGISNLNHKGLVTFDREVKKDAFYFYKANWSKEPVLHIVGKRNNRKVNEKVDIKVYSNSTRVILFVNNKKVASQKTPSDINIFEFKDIVLNNGKNSIKVMSKKEGLSDEVIWTLSKKQ